MDKTNNYLGTEKIGKLMRKFSIPCIMSLLVAALYNVVDQIFIGWGVGYLGNGATNVVFPITVIALAFALLIGDGCAAYVSLCQGRKDTDGIRYSVGNAAALLLAVSVIYTALLIFCRNALLGAFGATENNIAYAIEYYNVILIGMPFYIFANGMNSVVRADGSPAFAMVSMIVGAVINLILDPIAIFVLHMGMTGAALATIIGQISTAVLAAYYLAHAKTFKLSLKCFKLRKKECSKLLPLGVSSFLTQAAIVVIMGVMNTTMVNYGARSRFGADIPLTVIGIVMKLFQIVISVCIGLAVGCQPIVGFNYAAHNYDRVKSVYFKLLRAELIVGAVATIAFEVFPMQLIGIFGSESALYNEFAVLAFRIYLGATLLTCVQKSTSIFLQALGKPVMAMVLSLLRDIILVIPMIILLPMRFGVVGAIYSGPIADVLSMVAVVIFTLKIFHELNKDKAPKAKAEKVKEGKTTALETA